MGFERFKSHQPELWYGLERSDLDRIDLVIEIVRQRTAPDDKATGEPQPFTVLAYRVDQFIHTVGEALVEFAGDFHRASNLSQELDQRAGSPVFLFTWIMGRPYKLTLSSSNNRFSPTLPRDETYIIDFCDGVLGLTAERNSSV